MSQMTSNKPYLIRAFFEWIMDNDKTPYLLVNALYPGVQVPQDSVTEGQIILNISSRVVQKLNLGNERIDFVARFGGISRPIFVPTQAVMAIYAKESKEGISFQDADFVTDPTEPPDAPQPPTGPKPSGSPPSEKTASKKVSHLKIVK